MRKHFSKLLAAILALTMCLTACDNTSVNNAPPPPSEDDPVPGPFTLTACTAAALDTLDPAHSTAQGSETIFHHLFENLMRWADDGNGYAVLTPGQAESYTVETDYAGNATYTFTLREGICWSDGRAVTAQHFVTAWRRLADPKNSLPHSSLLRMVSGYDQVQETGNASLLAVSAPNDSTFVVTLNGSCAYFLEEVCASAYTVPLRQDLLNNRRWGKTAGDTVTNGAYTASHFSDDLVTLQRSETYYGVDTVSPEVLHFVPISDRETDYAAFLKGDIQLVQDLPVSALQELAADDNWRPEAITSTYGVMLNTLAPPFDDPDIRLAFRLSIDTQAVADALGDLTTRAAIGLVPFGVADYGQPTNPEAVETIAEETTLPDPNAEPVEETPVFYWDFRAHSQELVTLPEETDYADSCRQAQALMAQAGYAAGGGFPVVEYIYVESEANRIIARTLQSMWKEQLGVTVAVRGLSPEDYDAMLAAPIAETETETEPVEGDAPAAVAPFQLAGQTFTARHNDAEVFLEPWHSASTENVTGYHSDAYDILLDSAKAAVSFEARDAYLHDAEAILLTDVPVIPICHAGTSYQLAEGLTGLYRAPDGVYFLSAITDGTPATP